MRRACSSASSAPSASQVKLQVLAYPHVPHLAEAEAVEGVLHRLALGVQDALLEGHEDFDEHGWCGPPPTPTLDSGSSPE